MRNVGFIASSIGHVVLLGWGLVSLPAPESHNVSELEILPVELVSIADVTDVLKGEADAKPAEKVQEKKEKAPEVKKPEPEPKPDPAPKKEANPPKPTPPEQLEPDPVPDPEPKPALEPDPAPEPEPEAKPELPKPIAALPKVRPKPPKKTPPKQQAKKKRSFDVDALKALANQADQSTPTQSATDDQAASLGSRTGNQAAAMTQSELDALRAQIAPCWSPPVGAVDASQLRVRVEFGLDRQGNVVSGPEPIEFPASQFGVAAMESAIRAIRRCGPYTNLPQDKYNAWQRVRITFDPQDMF